MKRTITTEAAALGLTLTACSSDGGGSSSGGNIELAEVQDGAAPAAVDSASGDGLTLARSCVDEVAVQRSEEDATLFGSLDLGDLIESSAQDEDPPADFVAVVERCVAG